MPEETFFLYKNYGSYKIDHLKSTVFKHDHWNSVFRNDLSVSKPNIKLLMRCLQTGPFNNRRFQKRLLLIGCFQNRHFLIRPFRHNSRYQKRLLLGISKPTIWNPPCADRTNLTNNRFRSNFRRCFISRSRHGNFKKSSFQIRFILIGYNFFNLWKIDMKFLIGRFWNRLIKQLTTSSIPQLLYSTTPFKASKVVDSTRSLFV